MAGGRTTIRVGIIAPDDPRRIQIESALEDADMVLRRPRSLGDIEDLDVLVVVFPSEVEDWVRQTSLPVVAVTSETDLDAALALFRSGAADVVFAPVRPTDLVVRVWRVCGRAREGVGLDGEARLELRAAFGDCPNLITAMAKLPRIARSKAAVLISGETGTGKELCARAVHYLSPRRGGPFVAVNCGALPAEIAENELFGHERGAYTNADARQVGLVEEADQGTMFLDELDCLPAPVQAKLLRFLQDREYRRLGSARSRHVDVRIIAATNADLDEAVASGRLRQDLFFRLRTFELRLPPLRDRPDDIERLGRLFLARFADEHGRERPVLAPSAVAALLSHRWPGNVRELQQVMERAVVLAETDVVDASLLELETAEVAGVQPFGQAKAEVVRSFELRYVTGLLRAYRGNVTRAASAARKNRRAFFELLRKHAIDPARYRSDSTYT